MQDKDISALASEFDERLVMQEADWNARLARETEPEHDAQARFRNCLVKLAHRYARLTVLSFGFQQAFFSRGANTGVGEERKAAFFDRVSAHL